MAHRIAERMEWPHAAYSVATHGDAEKCARRMHVLPLEKASPDAETACVAVVVPTSAKRRIMWVDRWGASHDVDMFMSRVRQNEVK